MDSLSTMMGGRRRGKRYLLRDEFNDPRVAGAIHDTYATDGKNTRTVTDTEGKLSIVDGLLTCAGGKAAPAFYDPTLRFSPEAITRAVGRVVVWRKLTIADVTNTVNVGLFSETSGVGTGNTLRFITDKVISHENSLSGAMVAIPADGITYDLLMILRAAGALLYWKLSSASQWTFLWPASTNTTSPLYAGIGNYDAAFTLDRILHPLSVWMPTPRVSHGFSVLSPSDALGHAETGGLGAGGDGLAFVSATWSVSGGAAVNTPTVTGNVITNGTFPSDISGWTDASSAGASIAWNAGGWMDMLSDGAGSSRARQGLTTVVGTWYRLSFARTGGSAQWYGVGTSAGAFNIFPETVGSAASTSIVFLATSTTTWIQFRAKNVGASTLDDVTCGTLTTSTAFLLQQDAMPDANVVVSADLTVVAGFPAGVALVNDPTNPTAGIVLCHNATNLILYKFTDPTTWTALINTTATYAAGATICLSYDSTTGAARAYWNNALVGTQQTITDAEIVACRYIAAFNTGGGSAVDNLVCRNLFDTIPGV